MSERRTILLDPQSLTAQRAVWTIPKGVNFDARKVRVCNFQLSNTDGNQIYFNHAGVYSLLSKVSVLSLKGTEIDRLSKMEVMSIRALHMENGSQYSINRQITQNMCDSVFVNNLGQASLTEQYGADDGSVMSIYWDISYMLQYLQRRSVISEGMTVVLEFADPSVVGFPYRFVQPPVLAYDEYLTSIPFDGVTSWTYTSVIQDKLIIPQGSTGFEKRLNSFYNQMLMNVLFLDIDNKIGNPLVNAIDRPGSVLQIFVDGKQVIPLKGIDSTGKRLGFLQDFTGLVCVPGYDSCLTLKSGQPGFLNPNNGLYYGGKFAYGAFLLNRYIGNDFTISYNFTDAVTATSGVTLLILAETLRTYDAVADKVGFVASTIVPMS